MTTGPQCPHDSIEFAARAINITDPPAFMYVSSYVRCNDCHEPFHWRGVGSGTPNPDDAVVSADGYELRIPIAPGPGAVVALMQRAGLEQHLVDPNRGDRPNGE